MISGYSSQPDFFDLMGISGRQPEPIAVAPPQLDPETLFGLIEERDGVPGICASKFAEWSGYVRSTSFRHYIEEIRADLEQWGPLHSVSAMVPIGSGARREVRDYWLNRDQLNHALIHTRLPQLRALRTLVTTVFGKYQSGKLRPVDAETEVELQEAADRVISDTPRVMEIGAELARREDAVRAKEAADRAAQEAQQAHYSAMRTEKEVINMRQEKKRKPTVEAKMVGRHIVFHQFHGWCPCCHEKLIMKTVDRVEDHVHWDHAIHPHKNGPFDGWYVCEECNQKFEDNHQAFRSEMRPAWDAYLRHVKKYFKIDAKLPLSI